MAKKAYVWNGSAWVEITSQPSVPEATTSAAGIVLLVDSVASTSTSNAAVPNSVKTSYDQAVTATTNAATAQSTADSKAAVATTAPENISSTAAIGSGTTAARADHVHAISQTPSFSKVTLSAASGAKDQITISDTTSGAGLTIGADTNLYRSAADVLKSDSNLVADNVFPDYATAATAAGTTTLTNASKGQQYFTGTSTQTITLPVASTLALGWRYRIVNNSTGTLTVNSSGSNLVGSLYSGDSADVTCVLASGTTAASWDFDVQTNSGMRLISTNTLGTANQTFTISSIPSTYKSLLVYGHNFKSSTATAANLNMLMNTLTTTTYAYKAASALAATTTLASNASASAAAWALDNALGTTGAGLPVTGSASGSWFRVEFPNYSSATYKNCIWTFGTGSAAAAIAPGAIVTSVGNQSTTAVISSLSFSSSSATNIIAAGAVVEIYGVY